MEGKGSFEFRIETRNHKALDQRLSKQSIQITKVGIP